MYRDVDLDVDKTWSVNRPEVPRTDEAIATQRQQKITNNLLREKTAKISGRRANGNGERGIMEWLLAIEKGRASTFCSASHAAGQQTWRLTRRSPRHARARASARLMVVQAKEVRAP